MFSFYEGGKRDHRFTHSRYLLSQTSSGKASQWFVSRIVVFTAWYVCWVVALKYKIVEDGTLWASDQLWVSALVADVEGAAVIWLDVTWVDHLLSVDGVVLSRVRAGEAVGKDLNAYTATLADTGVFPLASAGEFVED